MMSTLTFRRCVRSVIRSVTRRLSTQAPEGRIDRYGGISLDIGKLAQSKQCALAPEDFDKQLAGWMSEWRVASVKAAWLDIPIELGGHMSVAARHGFRFHHAEGATSTLCQWLLGDRDSGLPRYATHQVGCSGCVVREDTQEVLVVRDKYNPFALWKFPGGLSELHEDIETTAVREVKEETGIETVFNGVMMFRQQHHHPGAFGRSDMFFVCHMTPLTYAIDMDPREITHCQWMSLDELAANAQKSAITLRAIHMVRRGLNEGSFRNVVLDSEACKSVYKGMEFKIHNAHIEGMRMDEGDYLHSIDDNKTNTGENGAEGEVADQKGSSGKVV